jgi:hypothetical protein
MTTDVAAICAGKKRYRTPTAKPGEVKIVYGRASHYDQPDLCAVWGGKGAAKPDARMVMHALTEPRSEYCIKTMKRVPAPSLIEELEARGYDITTLRFTIQLRAALQQNDEGEGWDG